MRTLTLVFLSFILFACHHPNDKPDVSGIPVKFTITRFERDFFKIDTNNLAQGLADVNKQYPQFFPFYIQEILKVRDFGPSSYPVIRSVLSGYHGINDSIQNKYKDLDWLKDELTTSFKYTKYYYPDYKVPNIITFIGSFDAPGVVLTPQYLGIGLHQFAGKNFSVYKDPQLVEIYPDYISRRFDKEYIAPNCMKAIVDDIYPDSSVGRTLIDQMIIKGKQWYLLDHFLPGTADSLKTGFTAKQLDWVNRNEGNIWGYITTNTDIYTIDPSVIQDYIGEGPFTRGMPEGASPGNIGQWVGWQIVKKFADKNPNLSIPQVMATSATNIFQEAKYKPK